MYDQEIGRWFNPDLLSEKYYPHSPYVFTANNPIAFIDPNGMDWVYNTETKKYENIDISQNEELPEYYEYIGAQDVDLLQYLGYDKEYYKAQAGWSPYFSVGSSYDGRPVSNSRAAIVLFILSNLNSMIGLQGEGHLRFTVLNSFDSENINDYNPQGHILDGINMGVIFNQYVGGDFAPYATVEVSLQDGTKYLFPLVSQNENAIKNSYTYSMGQTIKIPAERVSSPINGVMISTAASDMSSKIAGGKMRIGFKF